MEREYTVGALLVLVTIFVIALIIYFTVPGFNESVKQITDEVFGVSIKAQQEEATRMLEQEAISTFEGLKNCINQLKEKKDICTCFLKNKHLPEGFSIITSMDGKSIRLERQNIKVPETEPFEIEGIEFCILGKGVTRNPLPRFIIQQKNDKLIINDKELIENAPILYDLKEGDKPYLCFVTENSEEDIVKIREITDCSTGKIITKDNMLSFFNNFVTRYERCKTFKNKNNCLCDPIDFKELLDGYEITVEQNTRKKETTFSLQYTKNGKPEVVDKNLGVKTVSNNIFGFDNVKLIQKKGEPLQLDHTELEQGKKVYLKKWQSETETQLVIWKYTPFILKRDGERVTLISKVEPLEDFDKCASEYTFPTKECKVTDASLMLSRLKGEDPNYLCNSKPCKKVITDLIKDPGIGLLVASTIAVESKFNQNAGRGKDEQGVITDRGIMQFNLKTAKGYPKKEDWACTKSSCLLCDLRGCRYGDWRADPEIAIPAAANLLKEYSKPFEGYSDQELFTLASYNAGPDVITAAIKATKNKNKEPTWENVREEVTVKLFNSLGLNWGKDKVNIVRCYPYNVEAYKKVFASEFGI